MNPECWAGKITCQEIKLNGSSVDVSAAKELVFVVRAGSFDKLEVYRDPDTRFGDVRGGVEYFELFSLPYISLRLANCAITRSATNRLQFSIQDSIFSKLSLVVCHESDREFWMTLLTANPSRREHMLRFPNTGYSSGFFMRPVRQLLPVKTQNPISSVPERYQRPQPVSSTKSTPQKVFLSPRLTFETFFVSFESS